MKAARRRSPGFTLIEAMVALSLLSIITGMAYTFYSFVNKQVVRRERRALEFDSAWRLLETIANNVRESKATIHLDAAQWTFLRRSGDTASYYFTEGKLIFNAVELTLGGKSLAAFSFDCTGNDSLLDMDGDRIVRFNELDADGDRKIGGREAENIAWISATLTIHNGSEEDTLTAVEAVKNNVEYNEGEFQTYF